MKNVSARRRAYGLAMKSLMLLAAGLTCALVVFMVSYVLYKGVPNITWQLLSTSPSYLSGTIGILPDILNTIYIVIYTLFLVLPLGVGAAIYLTEYASDRKLVGIIEYAAETLSGIPSIIYGLVGMLFFCEFLGMQTSLQAGAFTLVIMNLPTIMRTTQESLKTVPQSYREGAFGLGAGKWRVDPHGGAAKQRRRYPYRLHSGRRPDPGRVRRPAVHRRLCPCGQQLLCGAAPPRRHPHRGPVCLCQGTGGVRGGLRHRRHPDGACPDSDRSGRRTGGLVF